MLLCFGALLIGRMQQSDIPGLDVCRTRACYMWIVVGETTWDEARDIITHIPGWTLNPIESDSFIGDSFPISYIKTYSNSQGVIFDLSLHSGHYIARAEPRFRS